MITVAQRIAVVVLAVLFLVSAAAVATAQDSHYWTNQYGTQAQLLGGSVVGRAVDLSATYYNPAAIMFMKESSGVILTTNAFQYQRTNLDSERFGEEDVSNSRFNPRPSIFTGLLPASWAPGQLGYVFLTRMDVKLDLDARGLFDVDAIQSIPGDEVFFGEQVFRQDVSDGWYGVSYADSVDEHLAFGATGYVNYHGQRTRRQTLAQAIAPDGSAGATATYIDEFSYWKIGLSLKMGIAFQFEPLTVGVTFTTPRVQFPMGDGKVITTRSFTGLDLNDGDILPDSDIAADEHDKLTPTFKFPMSAAVGISYDMGDMTVHASSEWFSKIDRYIVLDSRPVVSTVLGQSFDTFVFESRKEVINLGLGLEYRATRTRTLFGSFWTDTSAHPGEDLSNHTQHIWSIKHVSAGVSGNFVRAEVTLGVSWSWGSKNFTSNFGFRNPSEANGLLGDGEPTEVSYRNLGFLIGFSF